MSTKNMTYPVTSANKGDADWIKRMMDRFDASMLPQENVRDINFVVTNDQNERIGGIIARTRFSTVYIDTLWVAEEHRRKGIGKKLVQEVEREAIKMGCIYSELGSWESYGTKHFYESMGYVVVSVSIDSPPGQRGYWFNKKLV